jgi:hypothetical protein
MLMLLLACVMSESKQTELAHQIHAENRDAIQAREAALLAAFEAVPRLTPEQREQPFDAGDRPPLEIGYPLNVHLILDSDDLRFRKIDELRDGRLPSYEPKNEEDARRDAGHVIDDLLDMRYAAVIAVSSSSDAEVGLPTYDGGEFTGAGFHSGHAQGTVHAFDLEDGTYLGGRAFKASNSDNLEMNSADIAGTLAYDLEKQIREKAAWSLKYQDGVNRE